mmetsp:Transcript_628/g.1486  ORF Transcript_628/g.1486 Transcript_628/m.1486 type:complete len:204 (+) Transcript_628:446-1057(+)
MSRHDQEICRRRETALVRGNNPREARDRPQGQAATRCAPYRHAIDSAINEAILRGEGDARTAQAIYRTEHHVAREAMRYSPGCTGCAPHGVKRWRRYNLAASRIGRRGRRLAGAAAGAAGCGRATSPHGSPPADLVEFSASTVERILVNARRPFHRPRCLCAHGSHGQPHPAARVSHLALQSACCPGERHSLGPVSRLPSSLL